MAPVRVDEGQAPSFPTIEADLNSDDQHEPHRTHTDRDSGSCSEAGTVSRNFRSPDGGEEGAGHGGTEHATGFEGRAEVDATVLKATEVDVLEQKLLRVVVPPRDLHVNGVTGNVEIRFHDRPEGHQAPDARTSATLTTMFRNMGKPMINNYVPRMAKYKAQWEAWGEAQLVTGENVQRYLKHLQNEEKASSATLEATFKALQKMRSVQAVIGYPVPRSLCDDLHLKVMMTGIRVSAAEDASRSLVDKGAHVDSGSISADDKRKLVDWYMTDQEAGPAKTSLMFCALMLFMDATHLYGEDARGIRLHQLFARKLDVLGPDDCWALGIIVDTGKHSKKGRFKKSWALRHRNPEECAIGRVLMWLMFRWAKKLHNRKFPSMDTKESWYGACLFTGRCTRKPTGVLDESGQEITCDCKGEMHPISYSAQYSSAHLAHLRNDVAVSNICWRAERSKKRQRESSEESKKEVPWSREHAVKAYMSDVPVDACLARAGMSLKHGAAYVLKRGRVEREPYQDLADLVFPSARQLLQERVKANQDAKRETAHLKDVSAQNLLELLVEGAWWVMQDLAILQDRWGAHELFKHELFKHPLWPEFSAKVVELHNTPDIAVARAGRIWHEKAAVLQNELENSHRLLADLQRQLEYKDKELAWQRSLIEKLIAGAGNISCAHPAAPTHPPGQNAASVSVISCAHPAAAPTHPPGQNAASVSVISCAHPFGPTHAPTRGHSAASHVHPPAHTAASASNSSLQHTCAPGHPPPQYATPVEDGLPPPCAASVDDGLMLLTAAAAAASESDISLHEPPALSNQPAQPAAPMVMPLQPGTLPHPHWRPITSTPDGHACAQDAFPAPCMRTQDASCTVAVGLALGKAVNPWWPQGMPSLDEGGHGRVNVNSSAPVPQDHLRGAISQDPSKVAIPQEPFSAYVRDLDTLWAMYYDGLPALGKPPLRVLEAQYGVKWRPWIGKCPTVRVAPGLPTARTYKQAWFKLTKVVARVDLYAKTLAKIRGVKRDESIDREAFRILRKQKASILVDKMGVMEEICLKYFLEQYLTKAETGRLGKEENHAELLSILNTHACP